MRELTIAEQDLAEAVIASVLPNYIGVTRAEEATLERMRVELDGESYQRHAADPTFPTMKWRTHQVERSYLDDNQNTVFEKTGEIIARPIEINGEEIRWPAL